MKFDKTELSILAFVFIAAPYISIKVTFNDIGLQKAVEDGSFLRTSLYLAIGTNPNQRHIPETAVETGNCALIQKLERAGAMFDYPRIKDNLEKTCPSLVFSR